MQKLTSAADSVRAFAAGAIRARPHVLVVGAVLGVSASALAAPFTLSMVAVIPNGTLYPSSGSFVTQYALPDAEDAFHYGLPISVYNDPVTWRLEFDNVMATTWLAVDPYGPKGQYGSAPYGTGWFTVVDAIYDFPPTHVPSWNFSLGIRSAGLAVNGKNGDPVNGDGLSPAFYGRHPGFAWGAGVEASFRAASAYSQINRTLADSLFIGHLVLSDPEAIILGDDLLIAIRVSDSRRFILAFVPLDGSDGRIVLRTHPITLGDEIPMHIEYERNTFTNSLGSFTALDMYILSNGGSIERLFPPDEDSDLPSLPAPDPDAGRWPADNYANGSFTTNDLAIVVRTGSVAPDVMLETLQGAGFDPHRYTKKQWKKLMKGLYEHRLASLFDPAPTKEEKKAAMGALLEVYETANDLSSLVDTGAPDANDDGSVTFADVARILEVEPKSPDKDRLREVLTSVGMEPDLFTSSKDWKATILAFYEARVLPEFTVLRDKKQQKRDKKTLISTR